jgi:hypothetical protein
MKKLMLLGLLALGSMQLYAQEIAFETEVIDYGTIEKAANGVRKFQFKNTGDAPLVITNAQKSCGCTVPQWPKEPIMPGESGIIEVKYDTKRVGAFTKYVTVTSNAKNNSTVRLKIQGKVEPEAAPTPVKEQNLFSK